MADERLVTVCSACFRAACWQGLFYCDEAKTAGSVKKSIAELRQLDRELPDYRKEATRG